MTSSVLDMHPVIQSELSTAVKASQDTLHIVPTGLFLLIYVAGDRVKCDYHPRL